jgi:hypothetical protein
MFCMLTALACVLIFLLMAALMYLRRISALLAVPLMGVMIAIAGGVPVNDILNDVIAKGALKLNAAYTTTMFGAMLADFIGKKGIAKTLVRWTAEMSSDNPFVLGALLTAVTALLFSTLGGLGVVIMCGTVVLPVMLSVGLSELTAAGLFLFGISLGGLFNLANWQLYMTVLGLSRDQVAAFVVPFAAIEAFVVLLFLAIQLKLKDVYGHATVAVLGAVAVLVGLYVFTPYMPAVHLPTVALQGDSYRAAMSYLPQLQNIIWLAVILALISWAYYRHSRNIKGCPAMTMLTPLLPLVLVLCFHWEIIPAFVAGLLYGLFISWERNSISLFTRAIIDGTATVVPAVLLMVGIGILLSAVMHPAVSEALVPLLAKIIPHHAIPYIATFTLIAPAALYRGPLNIWGMGSGLAVLMKASALLGSQAIMGMLLSVGTLQGVCDPTNTQNIWVGTYLRLDPQRIMLKAMPYAWICAAAGLCLSAASGYVPW